MLFLNCLNVSLLSIYMLSLTLMYFNSDLNVATQEPCVHMYLNRLLITTSHVEATHLYALFTLIRRSTMSVIVSCSVNYLTIMWTAWLSELLISGIPIRCVVSVGIMFSPKVLWFRMGPAKGVYYPHISFLDISKNCWVLWLTLELNVMWLTCLLTY